MDLPVARTHARLWADLKSRALMAGAHDLIIAATALTHRLALLTVNVREFDRVDGLMVRRFSVGTQATAGAPFLHPWSR